MLSPTRRTDHQPTAQKAEPTMVNHHYPWYQRLADRALSAHQCKGFIEEADVVLTPNGDRGTLLTQCGKHRWHRGEHVKGQWGKTSLWTNPPKP